MSDEQTLTVVTNVQMDGNGRLTVEFADLTLPEGATVTRQPFPKEYSIDIVDI